MFEIGKFYFSFPIEPIRTVWVRRNCLVQIFKTPVEQKLVLIYFATFSPLKIIPSFLLFQVQALLYQKPVKITLCVWVSALICHLIPLGTLVACALSRRTFILQRLHTHKRIRRKSPRVAHSECREIENPKKRSKNKNRTNDGTEDCVCLLRRDICKVPTGLFDMLNNFTRGPFWNSGRFPKS